MKLWKIMAVLCLSVPLAAQVQLGRNVKIGQGASGTTFEQQVIPPIGGQYVVIYPTSGTITSDPHGDSIIGAQGGHFKWSCSNGIGLCTIAPYMDGSWTGFTLPSYVNPANVTAVYAFAVTSADALLGALPSGGSNVSRLACSTMGPSATLFPSFATPTTPWSGQQNNSLTTITGATVSSTTCTIRLGTSTAFNSGIDTNIPAVGLIVYYTGDPPPTRTAIDVVSPLAYNPSALTLSDDAVQVDSINGIPGAFTFTGSGVNCVTTTCTFGGGGAVSSVANSDGTLTISPTTGSVVASLALAHANTWTGKQTQPAPLFSDLTGLTQCLHVNTSGQVSGTGSDCGAGGGGLTGSGTTNYYSLWTGTTALGNGHLDDGVTTAGTITSSEPIAVGGSTHGVVIPAGPAVAGAAGKAVYASDATSGFAEVNENNTGLARLCSATNGVCAGGSAVSNPVTCTVNSTTDICITLAPYYGSADGATTTTTSATFAVGTSGSVASCSTFSANQGVYIAGAGAAGANYIGTVVSCSGTTLTVTPATSTSVASGAVVQHDETAAIQAAVTALASTGGSIYFPLGTYLVNGPLQDTGGANAMIVMPHLTIANATVTHFRGFNIPSNASGGQTYIITQQNSGSVFGAFCASCGQLNFTFAGADFENLLMIAPSNPSITLVNGFWMSTLRVEHFACSSLNGVLPTSTTGACLVYPAAGNDVRLEGGDITAQAFGTCVQVGEHTTITDVRTDNCIKAIVPESRSGAPYAGNVAHIVHAWDQQSTYVLAAGPQLAAIKIDTLDIETAGTNGIYDPTNLLYGDVGFNVQAAAGAVTPTNPAVNGAANLCIHNIQFPNGTTYGGACPVSLGNFAAHKFFGNNTGSTAAPGAQSIGVQDVSPNAYVAGSGTANAQTATFTPAITSLVAGLNACWLPAAANTTTTPTFAPNGLTAKTITKNGTAALAANDLTNTAVACAIYDGTEWQLQNPQTAGGGGGTTVSAAAPYINIGGTKYVAQTMWPLTAMFSGSFLDANTSTITSGANGSTLFSYGSTSNSFYGTTATSSIEAELQVMDKQSTTGSTTTGLNPAIGGIWIYDSTNSKIYTLRVYIMSATGFNGNEKYYVGAGSVWTYTGSGSPSTTATTDLVSMLGAAMPHLKLSVSGGTLTESISMDGGQTYVTLTTIGSIGTIAKAGIYLGNEPTAVDVLSVAVN